MGLDQQEMPIQAWYNGIGSTGKAYTSLVQWDRINRQSIYMPGTMGLDEQAMPMQTCYNGIGSTDKAY
jgi:hypothetical protein